MLFHKLFSSFEIDGAMNFLSGQVAREGWVFFPAQKIPVYLTITYLASHEFGIFFI